MSAKKRDRQNEKRRARNRARKSLVREEVKAFTTAVGAGDVKKAEELFPKVVQRLDRTAAKNTIHKNAASRKRSRLAKKLNALKAGRLTKVVAKGAKKVAKSAGTKAANA